MSNHSRRLFTSILLCLSCASPTFANDVDTDPGEAELIVSRMFTALNRSEEMVFRALFADDAVGHTITETSRLRYGMFEIMQSFDFRRTVAKGMVAKFKVIESAPQSVTVQVCHDASSTPYAYRNTVREHYQVKDSRITTVEVEVVSHDCAD